MKRHVTFVCTACGKPTTRKRRPGQALTCLQCAVDRQAAYNRQLHQDRLDRRDRERQARPPRPAPEPKPTPPKRQPRWQGPHTGVGATLQEALANSVTGLSQQSQQ